MEKEVYVLGVDNFYDLKRESWSGALQTLERVEELGIEDTFLELINDVIGEKIGETELNDYIWFTAEEDLKEFYNIDVWEED